MSSTSGRTGRPPRTSRAQIVVAARKLIDDEGWQRLTIRRLAAEIGTAPTTLYHHVRDKEDLLVQLLNDHADRVPRPELPADPFERIITAAVTIHDGLAGSPWIVEVLTADDLLGENALWMVETMVSGAVECGCGPEQAVHLYRGVWYYTVGEILVRANAARRRAGRGDPVYRDAVLRQLGSAELPHLAALADRWPVLAAADTYRAGLRALVAGTLAQYGLPHG